MHQVQFATDKILRLGIPDWWGITLADLERLSIGLIEDGERSHLRQGRERATISHRRYGAEAATLAEELQELSQRAKQILGENHFDSGLRAAAFYHLRFENIHPFRDSNGRIGRTILAAHCHAIYQIPVEETLRQLNAHVKEYKTVFMSEVEPKHRFELLLDLLARITGLSDRTLNSELPCSIEPLFPTPGTPQNEPPPKLAPPAPPPAPTRQPTAPSLATSIPQTGKIRRTAGMVCATLGTALASYLLGLKLARLPCGVGGCEAVILSAYGSIFGVPVSLFGLVAWAGLIFGRHPVRRTAAAVLFLGSLWFIGVQALVLHTFCPLCCLHAALAMASAVLITSEAPPSSVFALGAIAGWIGLVILEQAAPPPGFSLPPETLAPTPPPRPALPFKPTPLPAPVGAVSPANGRLLPASLAGQAWLGPVANDSALLVISFTCPHCVDELWTIMDQFEKNPPKRPPKVMVLSSGANLPVQKVVVAAILALSTKESEATAFAQVMGAMRSHRMDMLTGKTAKVQAVFDLVCPDYAQHLDEAEALIKRHHATLDLLKVKNTPFMLSADGRGGYMIDRSQF